MPAICMKNYQRETHRRPFPDYKESSEDNKPILWHASVGPVLFWDSFCTGKVNFVVQSCLLPAFLNLSMVHNIRELCVLHFKINLSYFTICTVAKVFTCGPFITGVFTSRQWSWPPEVSPLGAFATQNFAPTYIYTSNRGPVSDPSPLGAFTSQTLRL